MDIIERLQNDEMYIDAIDDAIIEIKRLRKWSKVWKQQARIERDRYYIAVNLLREAARQRNELKSKLG